MEICDQLHAPAALSTKSEPNARSIGLCVICVTVMDVLELEEFLAPKICYAFLQLLGSLCGET